MYNKIVFFLHLCSTGTIVIATDRSLLSPEVITKDNNCLKKNVESKRCACVTPIKDVHSTAIVSTVKFMAHGDREALVTFNPTTTNIGDG